MENETMSESSARRDPILRWSIDVKLTIAFLVLAVIPMSATAYYNLTQGQSEVAKVARDNLVDLSRSTARRIEQLLTENQRTSATLAGEPVAAQFLAASEEERQALTPQVYQMLQNFADTHPDYDAPGLLDVNGVVVASLAEVLVGKDRSFRDYFQASIQGQPYVSSMLVGRATGRPGVFLTNPVVTAEGEIVGIDIVWLKGDTIWSIIDDVVVGEEGIAYLVDQDGVIIAHPDRDLLYHSLGELTPEAVATISATIRFGTIEDTDTPLIPPSLGMDDLAAALVPPPQPPPIPGEKSGTYRYYSPLDHRDHVVGYTRLEAYPWTVVVDLPEVQFLAPLQRLGAVAWISVGAVGAMTLIISILLVRTITRPIRRLTNTAMAVEQGQPFEPADIENITLGHDEIAHLGRVFNGMVFALQQELTERRKAEERIEHLNFVLRAIRKVNQLITRERDRDRLLKGACDDLIETRGYYSAWIALFDEAGGLVTAAEAGLGEEFRPLVEQLKRGELTACGRRALSQPGIVVTEDPLSACADCPLAVNCGGREAMTVRLEYEDRVYGLSSVSIPADFTADEEERSLFREVAGDIAFALHNIELEEERRQAEEALRQYTERLRVQHAIDGATLAGWAPEAIAQVALRHVRQLVPCQRASVVVFDLEAHEAELIAAHTNGETTVSAGARLSPEDFGNVQALQRGRPCLVEDILTLSHPTPVDRAWSGEGVRSYVTLPLITHGELIGILNLGAESPSAFAPEHVDIARELADQLAIAIQQARLYEQVQRHAEELEQRVAERTAQLERRTVQLQVAAEVARDAITAHDAGELLDRAVNLIRERFGFYHAGIFLVDERGEYAVLKAATGEAGRQMLEQGHKLKVGEAGIVSQVTGTGQPRIAPAVDADAAHFKNPLLPETRSEMALPLKVGERVIGALDVQSVQEAAFDEDDVAILRVMADQLAVVIEKARLFERTQAALEERLRTVVSSAPVVLYALDREGTLTLAEGKGLEALGLKPGEVVGRTIFDLHHDVPKIVENVRRALAGEAFVSTVEVDGVTFETWYSPLRDEGGEVTGVIGVATDVTERKHLEEQIRRQDRLAAVGQLAGGIAHDFNNFLTTIMLYAQILRGKPHLPPDLAPGLETILDESRRAAQLVQQILDFSRRSPIKTQPVDLKPFIEERIEILQRTLPENIRLLLETRAEEYVANADSTSIQQVVMNLAVNARDAMPEGGELRIGLSRVEVRPGEEPPVAEMAAGAWVCLAVSDTGIGIPPDVLSHIFEPFFSTKEPGKGTGLGLAQVYGIVQQHEGHIGVETEVGRGTTFRVYLPAYGSGKVEEVSAEAAAPPEGQGETILLVEDEEKVREAGREALESLGYRVLTAVNGREALKVYQSEVRVDVVVTDIVMPEMGGRELVRGLKKANPHMKAVAITGHVTEEIQELGKEGILEVIQKPLDVNRLARVVRRVLDTN